MNNRVQPSANNDPISGLVPNLKELVWVQCKEYRCLAYLDATGKWKGFVIDRELTGVVQVFAD